MLYMKSTKLTEAQCTEAMRDGDFGPDVRNAAATVVVVLTQGWCPQWIMMKRWFEDASGEAAVFHLEYDKEEFFEPFMAWKEDFLGNRSVPYLRYYRDGVLTGQSNYVSKDAFKAAIRRQAPSQ